MVALLLIAQLAAAPAPAPERAAPRKAAAPADRPAPSPSGRTVPPPTHVEADHIEYRYREQQTVMTGKPLVKLRREDATLVCKRLTADNDAVGDIQHAVCEGDVKLTRAGRVVTCNRATYEGASGRVVCRGDPVLHDGESIIYCDEVVYDLDQDKVSLTRPKGTLVQKPGQPLPIAKGKAR